MKEQSNLSQLMGYAGNHRYLTYLSMLLSAVSAVLALFPFVFLFFIIREVIEVAPDYTQAVNVVRNGWMAVLFALVSILIYITGLMCSHLSAFRIAGNIRKNLMAHIADFSAAHLSNEAQRKLRNVGHQVFSDVPRDAERRQVGTHQSGYVDHNGHQREQHRHPAVANHIDGLCVVGRNLDHFLDNEKEEYEREQGQDCADSGQQQR